MKSRRITYQLGQVQVRQVYINLYVEFKLLQKDFVGSPFN